MNAGRRIDAELVDNEFIGPTLVIGMSEGIRLVNFVDADGGVIVASLSGNRVHGFQLGCIITNNRSSNAVVHVRSSGDRFFGNALGCLIAGGLIPAATGVANSNTTTFEAHGSAFVHNTAAIQGFETGGIIVAGGRSVIPNATSDNNVSVALWETEVAGNDRVDLEALGADLNALHGIAGTNNHAVVELHGASTKIHVVGTSSRPADPTGTNTLTVSH
jgi:hypothetical protein